MRAAGRDARRSTSSATTSSRCDTPISARLALSLGPRVVPHVRGVPRPARRRDRRGARPASTPIPGFRFVLDGQAIVLEDYLEVRPERRAELVAGLRGGPARASGRGTCNPTRCSPRGETHVRNLLHGRAVAERVRPGRRRVAYVPDSFGHPGAVPAALRRLRPRSVRLLARQRIRARRARPALPLGRARRQRRCARGISPRATSARAASTPTATSTRPRARLQGRDRPARRRGQRSGAADERLRPPARRPHDRRGRRRRSAPSACCSTTRRARCPRRRAWPSFAGALTGARIANLLPGVWSARMPLKLRNRAIETLLTAWAEPWAAFGRVLGLPDERPALDARVAHAVAQPGARLDLRLLDRRRCTNAWSARYDDAEGLGTRDRAARARTARRPRPSRATRRGARSRTSSCSTRRPNRAPTSCACRSKGSRRGGSA